MITAIVVVAVFAMLLFLLIKAKKAESDVAKWKIAEYVLLGIYIVAAIGFSGPFFKFFYISSNKESLYNDAESEINSIQELYASYDKMVEKEMNISQQNMINYVQSGNFNYQLRQYMNEMGIQRNDVAAWFNRAKKACKMQPDSTLIDIKLKIANWDFMELSQCAYSLTKKGEEAASAINAKMEENVKNKRIPRVIAKGETTGFSVGGFFVLIILHLIVLLNYLVTRRSKMVMPNAMKMGIDLFN